MSDRPAVGPVERARASETAGDACVYESRIEEAKVNYGTAIDAFLDARAFEEVIRICRKLIRLSPDVVRTRFTLLFLLVGLGRYEEAREALDEYVRLVRASGTRSYAIPRLQLLSHVTGDAEMSARVRVILSRFGAGQTRSRESSGDYPAAEPRTEAERRERWETLLPIALKDD